MPLVDRFIAWATERTKCGPRPVVTFEGDHLFDRYEFVRWDEMEDARWDRSKDPKRPGALPWWMPCNVFLHHWQLADGVAESFHDHPRWSITICLKGRIVERTPWADRLLTPGSIVIRSRKAIHAFRAPDDYRGDTWTLFIVGRRKYRQNKYHIIPR